MLTDYPETNEFNTAVWHTAEINRANSCIPSTAITLHLSFIIVCGDGEYLKMFLSNNLVSFTSIAGSFENHLPLSDIFSPQPIHRYLIDDYLYFSPAQIGLKTHTDFLSQ